MVLPDCSVDPLPSVDSSVSLTDDFFFLGLAPGSGGGILGADPLGVGGGSDDSFVVSEGTIGV